MSVLKPWTNIEVEQRKDEYCVSVWGRKYTFHNSIFPTSIVSLNEEILYSPIELEMDFGDTVESPYSCRYEVFEASDDKIIVNTAALCGNLIINAAVTIEYDGFIKTTFRLVPCGTFNKIKDWKNIENIDSLVKLKSAKLVMKFRKNASSLFHFWPDAEAGVVAQDVVTSGAFYETEIPFKPTVWIGNEKYGFNFCMETDENIQLLDKNKCIRTRAYDDYNEISLQLLEHIPRQWEGREESWGMPLEPISYEIMFQATPVKPYAEDFAEEWRVYRSDVDADDLVKVAEMGTKWVVFHESWSMIQNYCYPENKEALERNIRKCHELGMKAMLYFGYEYSTAMLDWEKKKDTYLNKNLEGNFTGGWTRAGIYQKAFITCYKGGYHDEMIDCAIRAIDELGADGIYTDGTYIPWECANEAHGCGYRDENGNLHFTYPILAVREHVKRLYEVVHERNGRVDAHQSACCVMPILSFCDSYWDGENIQNKVAENMEECLNLDAFRCEYYGKNFGLVAQFIAYLKPPKYDIRNVLSLCLIHDVIARPILDMDMLNEVSKIWKTYDDFGKRNAVWRPYWENNSKVRAENNDIYISSFEKEDEILAFVSKFGKSEKEDILMIPEQYTKLHEVFDDKDYVVKDGVVKCELAPATAYMFRIKK